MDLYHLKKHLPRQYLHAWQGGNREYTTYNVRIDKSTAVTFGENKNFFVVMYCQGSCISRRHMNVALGNNNASGDFYLRYGTFEITALGISYIAGLTDHAWYTKLSAVSKRNFNLCFVTERTKLPYFKKYHGDRKQ